MQDSPTPLQTKLATRILSYARLSDWQPGHHLTEDSLLPILGTSRSPVRAAMAWLEASGVLERRPNKGFFLRALPPAALEPETVETEADNEKVYTAIAMDRLSHALPDQVSENELIRRYGLSRAQLRHVLARITSEGWIERKPGRGWAFQPLIDTLEAYQENYRFRQMIEPVAMRSPEFQVEIEKIDGLRHQQVHVRESGYRSMSQIELYEINACFHDALAQMSNNRFFVQTLQRLNQLRRLIEYGQPLDRQRVRRICDEHVEILDELKAGSIESAARLLELHLSNAIVEKIRGNAENAEYINGM
jgi:DNA-binding GntR family transcriptional regulator